MRDLKVQSGDITCQISHTQAQPAPKPRLEASFVCPHMTPSCHLQPTEVAGVAMAWDGSRKLPERKGHPQPTVCLHITWSWGEQRKEEELLDKFA